MTTLDLRKSADGKPLPEEDPLESKRKSIEIEKTIKADEQTPTVTADHFANQNEGVVALKKFLASGQRYGFPGTDGTLWSNYKAYMKVIYHAYTAIEIPPEQSLTHSTITPRPPCHRRTPTHFSQFLLLTKNTPLTNTSEFSTSSLFFPSRSSSPPPSLRLASKARPSATPAATTSSPATSAPLPRQHAARTTALTASKTRTATPPRANGGRARPSTIPPATPASTPR